MLNSLRKAAVAAEPSAAEPSPYCTTTRSPAVKADAKALGRTVVKAKMVRPQERAIDLFIVRLQQQRLAGVCRVTVSCMFIRNSIAQNQAKSSEVTHNHDETS